MSQQGFALFDTAIGGCGVVWGPRGIVGGQLPLPSAIDMRDRLMRRYPDAREAEPPKSIADVIDAVRELFETGSRDLADIELDMEGVPAFSADVYRIARAIPPGATRTYGDIARDLGDVALSRDVGQALGNNPFPPIVPCHRVLAANGKTGGFSANGGVETKMRMLSIERARTSDAPSLFDDLPLAAPPRKGA
ncbi:methylated-DNA--[protein]-cysteine S-methyltransferase [Terrarubrum flagellatum]|uniref:methylated-DNA--[protein]-cysteine S-methyltransferase n=1 Tax=Terrirubrum flagellatum TaxID=2895980 RepID=UPI0031452348